MGGLAVWVEKVEGLSGTEGHRFEVQVVAKDLVLSYSSEADTGANTA